MSDKSILLRMAEEGVEAPRVTLEGTVRNDEARERYEVLGEVARGGVGVVHRGRDNDIGRDVALKVLHDHHLQTPELVQRFVEEAQIGGQLQHPGIVPVYELGLQSDQRPYFAMKLVKGDTLAAKLASRSDPSEDRRALLAVFREVCRTMAYAHARGVIHRDLKPSNIMIGNFGEVQVVDWGFAKVMRKGGLADESLTRKAERDRTMISTVRSGEGQAESIAGSVMGTPAYMPPEQAQGRVDELDERSDLFSLGGILCEILTGEAPYTGHRAERMDAATHARLEPALTRLGASDADQTLLDLCRRCLSPLPKDRPKNAEGLAVAVATYLANAQTRAHRAQVRAVKAEAEADEQRRRRRQTRLVGGGVLAVVVLAVGAYLWVDAARTGRERERREAVELALQDAAQSEAAADWPAALAAAERALDLGHEGAIVEQIRGRAKAATARARRRGEDEVFLAKLEEIRGRFGSTSVPGGNPHLKKLRETAGLPVQGPTTEAEIRAVDAGYVRAFEARFQSVEAGADSLAASHRVPQFAANLGFWAWLRRTKEVLQGSDWRSLDRLARRLEPGHDKVRDALIDDDEAALLAIAGGDGEDLPGWLAAQVGLSLTDLGNTREAIDFLEAHRRKHPRDFWIHVRLGHAAKEHRDHRLAAQHLAVAVALRPEHATTWSRLAWSLRELGDLEGAEAAYRKALALAPDAAVVHNGLGALLIDRLGRYDDGIRAFEHALELDPALLVARSNIAAALTFQGKYEEAIALVQELLERTPQDYAALSILGLAHARRGDARRAVAALERAAALAPENEVGVHQGLAGELINVKRAAEAVEILQRVLERAPDEATVHNTLGFAQVQVGDLSGALASFHRALALAPEVGTPHIGLGSVHQAEGEYAKALAAFLRALESGADEFGARMHLGTLLCDHLGRYDAAIEQFRKIIELRPDHFFAYGNIAVAHRNQGQWDEALAMHEQAIRVAPRVAGNHESLGITLRLKGDFAAARRAFEQALTLAPDVAQTHANLAIALRRLGERPAAEAALVEAVALDPKDAWIRRVFGNHLLAQLDLERALAQLERGAELRSDDEDLQAALKRARWLSEREARLEPMLRGDAEPEDWQEALRLARIALVHLDGHDAGSARLYAKAFTLHPPLAGDLGEQHRYNGACAAALAGAEWHPRSLAWLREDLARLGSWLGTGPNALIRRLEHWQKDSDLTSIRDADDLPDDFKKLWADVDTLLEKAREAAK